MLIQIILFISLGILAGILTGLIPGIHINLLGIFILSLYSKYLYSINTIYFIVFISSMAITHTFIDFIPSIFLGCPDTDTELSILPGHELLKKGKAYEAILLTAYGSLAAIFILILILIPSILLIKNTYELIKNLIPYILITASFLLLFLEKKRFTALFVFGITGILGTLVLNINLNQPLLPLLTGLFGSSAIILSIKNKTKIPKQIISKPKTKLLKPLIGALIASPLCSFFPGLGSGQAAIIGNLISRTNKKTFLILLGATNTLVMGFSFISLYAISKTRTGAAILIQEITKNLNLPTLILIIITITLSGIISFFIVKIISKLIALKITKINYTIISYVTLSILIFIVFLISGFLGIFILLTSTLTGIYCISLDVKRTNMMGCLLIPIILLYIF